MNPEQIKKELRKPDGFTIKRKIAILASLGLIDFIVISLYQLGVIRELPDLNVKYVDSNFVNASKEAYKMGLPDGPVSAMVYTLILVLIGVKGTKSSGRSPVWDVLLGGAILANAAGAADYLRVMLFKQKRVCLYCIFGAFINFWMLKLFARRSFKALRELKS